jgi:hypothetical protein
MEVRSKELILKQLLLGASLASFLLVPVRSAHANSYSIYHLTGDNGYNLIGINAAGDVIIESPFGCSDRDPNRCYEVFSAGELISESATLGDFAFDDGVSCVFDAIPDEYLVGRSVCNSGEQVAGVRNNGETEIIALLPAGNDLILNGTADVLVVNAAGDIAVVNGFNDEIDEVVPSPEPATFLLLLTAAIGLTLILRHRTWAR